MESTLAPISPKQESPFRRTGRLFSLGILSVAGYLTIALLSSENLQSDNPDAFTLTRFIQTYGFVFLCYWFMIAPLVKGRRMDPRHLWFALSFAFLFRAILFYTPLILNNDIYRYLWDGHTSLHGINPYRYAPSDVNTTPYRTDDWRKIDNPQAQTIYPPIFQCIFFVSEALYPGSITGMKFLLLVFDIGTIFLLMSALEAFRRPPEWCLIYAWSPLVIKEIANSGHVDAVSAFLMAAVILLMAKGKKASAAAALAALAVTHFFAVLFMPFFHREWKGRHFALFFLIIVLLYLPFLSPGVNPFAGFIAFAMKEQFNAGLFSVVEYGFRQLGGEAAANSDFLSRLAVLTAVLLTAFWQTIALVWRTQIEPILKACLLVIGVLLLCSPIVYPWYFIWPIPLLCFFPSRSWILMTGLVFLSYTYYYEQWLPAWAAWVEYGVFYIVSIIELCAPIKRWGLSYPSQCIIREGESPDEPL